MSDNKQIEQMREKFMKDCTGSIYGTYGQEHIRINKSPEFVLNWVAENQSTYVKEMENTIKIYKQREREKDVYATLLNNKLIESEKEIDRLRGLIDYAYYYGRDNGKPLSHFKSENNL